MGRKKSIGSSQMAIGFITIFISVFMLFFIFNSLENLSRECQSGTPPVVCRNISSFMMSMLIILLIIGGFVITICGTLYIILSG